MRLRSSGEVVNATLMEVFVVLCFMMIVLYSSNDRKLTEIGVKYRDVEEANKSLLAERDQLKSAVEDHAMRAAQSEKERDDLRRRYLSEHPRDCRAPDVPVTLLRVNIADEDQLEVEVLGSFLAHIQGRKFNYTRPGFISAFTDVWNYSLEQECRFRAIVSNAPSVETEAYKKANKAIAGMFRVEWR